jgi:hypothetical protein
MYFIFCIAVLGVVIHMKSSTRQREEEASRLLRVSHVGGD